MHILNSSFHTENLDWALRSPNEPQPMLSSNSLYPGWPSLLSKTTKRTHPPLHPDPPMEKVPGTHFQISWCQTPAPHISFASGPLSPPCANKIKKIRPFRSLCRANGSSERVVRTLPTRHPAADPSDASSGGRCSKGRRGPKGPVPPSPGEDERNTWKSGFLGSALSPRYIMIYHLECSSTGNPVPLLR